MEKQSVSAPANVAIEDAPDFPDKLRFTCGACGKTGKYHPGKVALDPAALKSGGGDCAERAFSCTGYFRCRHCGADGPWHFPPLTTLHFLGLVLEAVTSPERRKIYLGKFALFDGSCFHYPTEGEQYLKSLIEKDPGNSFLWTRLGNLFRNGGRPDLAEGPYRKALEVNPDDLEARYLVGAILIERGKKKKAAPYLQEVLLRARDAEHMDRDLRRKTVGAALLGLTEVCEEIGGGIDILPGGREKALAETRSGGGRGLRRYDLSNQEGVEAACSAILGERPPTAPIGPPPEPAPSSAPSSGPRRLNPRQLAPARSTPPRNAPCPCGSGYKYKNCCGRGERR